MPAPSSMAGSSLSWWWSWECVPSLSCSRVGGAIGDGAGGRGERCRAGWDALLAAVRRSTRRRGHGGVIERGDVDVIAHDGAGAVGGAVVTGDHDPRAGGDVDERRTQA